LIRRKGLAAVNAFHPDVGRWPIAVNRFLRRNSVQANACSSPLGITRRRLWDATTGNGAKIKSAQFSPQGRWAVAASFDYTARMWDVASC